MNGNRRMSLVGALQVLTGLRSDQVVVTTMSAAREWKRLSDHPLDFNYVPSTMGGGLPLGLGIALAQPQRDVIVLSGDGSLLMSLGSLVTVAASKRQNITVMVIDNGVYEVTGAQALVTTSNPIDLTTMAQAARFASVAEFDDLEEWKGGAAAALTLPGPRFVVLRVEPVSGDYTLAVPGPMAERIQTFRAALDR